MMHGFKQIGSVPGIALLTVVFFSCLPPHSSPAGSWMPLVRDLPCESANDPEVDIISEKNDDDPSGRVKVIYHVIYKVPCAFRDSVRKQGVVYDTVHVAGCAPLAAEGQPAVPVKTLFLELPGDSIRYSEVDIEIRVVAKIQLDALFIYPAQPPLMDPPPNGEAPFIRDESVYGTDAFFPENLLLKSRSVGMRDKQLLEIRFTPVQFNPVRKRVRFATHMELLIVARTDAVNSQSSEIRKDSLAP